MSNAVDAFPCGSRSTTSTWLPCRARHAARLTAVVVLPTPPFWLAMVITRQDGGWGHSRSVSPSAASAAWAGLTGMLRAVGTGPGLACPCAGTITGAGDDPGTSAVATLPPGPPAVRACVAAALAEAAEAAIV